MQHGSSTFLAMLRELGQLQQTIHSARMVGGRRAPSEELELMEQKFERMLMTKTLFEGVLLDPSLLELALRFYSLVRPPQPY